MRAVIDPAPGGPPADPRDALIGEQAERIAALEAMVADLRGQREAAERAGSRNSGNSSMLPGTGDLPGRKPPRGQRRAAAGGGPRGGQAEAGEAAGRPGRVDDLGDPGPDRGPLPGRFLLLRP